MFEYVLVSSVRFDAFGAVSCTFDTLAEAKQFAEWRREPCKIWECCADGWDNSQRLVVEYI